MHWNIFIAFCSPLLLYGLTFREVNAFTTFMRYPAVLIGIFAISVAVGSVTAVPNFYGKTNSVVTRDESNHQQLALRDSIKSLYAREYDHVLEARGRPGLPIARNPLPPPRPQPNGPVTRKPLPPPPPAANGPVTRKPLPLRIPRKSLPPAPPSPSYHGIRKPVPGEPAEPSQPEEPVQSVRSHSPVLMHHPTLVPQKAQFGNADD
ncbi:hypothetical protein EIP91_009615 [Steccherinum ochraceum]|uniref:Uncharacterized protein n=1 Tax=Steccherinum ochraceum TaxID=92696 RepID=A0A4R0R1G7_9APHY|nr:hypothetical protein EIP91_009615 [Steccherinum ochraceum]